MITSFIGTVVIFLLFLVLIQRFVGNSKTLSQRTRSLLYNVDSNLKSIQTKENKKNNPLDYCTPNDLLIAAEFIVHSSTKKARMNLGITDEAALRIRKRFLKEISEFY